MPRSLLWLKMLHCLRRSLSPTGGRRTSRTFLHLHPRKSISPRQSSLPRSGEERARISCRQQSVPGMIAEHRAEKTRRQSLTLFLRAITIKFSTTRISSRMTAQAYRSTCASIRYWISPAAPRASLVGQASRTMVLLVSSPSLQSSLSLTRSAGTSDIANVEGDSAPPVSHLSRQTGDAV